MFNFGESPCWQKWDPERSFTPSTKFQLPSEVEVKKIEINLGTQFLLSDQWSMTISFRMNSTTNSILRPFSFLHVLGFLCGHWPVPSRGVEMKTFQQWICSSVYSEKKKSSTTKLSGKTVYHINLNFFPPRLLIGGGGWNFVSRVNDPTEPHSSQLARMHQSYAFQTQHVFLNIREETPMSCQGGNSTSPVTNPVSAGIFPCWRSKVKKLKKIIDSDQNIILKKKIIDQEDENHLGIFRIIRPQFCLIFTIFDHFRN